MHKQTIMTYMNIKEESENKLTAINNKLRNLNYKLMHEFDDAAYDRMEQREKKLIWEREEVQECICNVKATLRDARKNHPDTYQDAATEFKATRATRTKTHSIQF